MEVRDNGGCYRRLSHERANQLSKLGKPFGTLVANPEVVMSKLFEFTFEALGLGTEEDYRARDTVRAHALEEQKSVGECGIRSEVDIDDQNVRVLSKVSRSCPVSPRGQVQQNPIFPQLRFECCCPSS